MNTTCSSQYLVRFTEQYYQTNNTLSLFTFGYLVFESTNGVMNEDPSHSPARDQVSLGHAWTDQDGILVTHRCQRVKLLSLENHFSIGLIWNNRKVMFLGNYRREQDGNQWSVRKREGSFCRLTAGNFLQMLLRKDRTARVARISDHNRSSFIVNQPLQVLKINFPTPLRLTKRGKLGGRWKTEMEAGNESRSTGTKKRCSNLTSRL